MSYIEFEKDELVNLEKSLNKEFVNSNSSGAYMSTTIVGCNTRKYHGLLVCPQEAIDDELHVLLSSIDETIVQYDSEFNLSIHRYPDTWSPRGHKYLTKFELSPIPTFYYQVGGVQLKKELLLTQNNSLLVRYSLVEAHSPTKIKIRPFMAYRCRHKLAKANVFAETKYLKINGGVKTRMYQGYSYLHYQFSRDANYTHVPDWYYNIEYPKDMERGYEAHEDLFCSGYFEIDLVKGSPLIFSVGINEDDPNGLAKLFSSELSKVSKINNFEDCLETSARQFIVKKDKKVEIVAGFPWFGRWGRDSLIALPGLTLCRGKFSLCKNAIDTLIQDMNGPLMPNVGHGDTAAFNSIDAPLWLFWTLQQYQQFTNTASQKIWDEYGPILKLILNGLANGKSQGIKMLENGLLYASIHGKALTWMDAIVDGKPVTPRAGLAVDINALWFNAIMYSLELAAMSEDGNFVGKWIKIAKIIPGSFKDTFWSKDKGYLADVVNGDVKDFSVRPNMIIAASMPYSPVSEKIRHLVVEEVKKELLTPRGLRTLSPKSCEYKGCYEGFIKDRDLAYHQGTVWPWLLGHYAEAYLNIHGTSGISHIKKMYEDIVPTVFEHGIGSVSEVFGGDPPYKAGGAVSQAWSVAEIIRMKYLLDNLNNKH